MWLIEVLKEGLDFIASFAINTPIFMLTDFAQALVMVFLGGIFIFGALFAGHFVRPASPNPVKSESYECGEKAVGPAWINFNIRFYLIALIFVIFDVEAALVVPAVAVYKGFLSAGQGWLAFVEIMLFVAILFVGLIYVWARGDLNWIKGTSNNRPSAVLPANSRSSRTKQYAPVAHLRDA